MKTLLICLTIVAFQTGSLAANEQDDAFAKVTSVALKSIGGSGPTMPASIADPGLYGPYWPEAGYGRSLGHTVFIEGQTWLGKSAQPFLRVPVEDLNDPIFKDYTSRSNKATNVMMKERRDQTFLGALPGGGHGAYPGNPNRKRGNNRPDIPDQPLHQGCMSPDCY